MCLSCPRPLGNSNSVERVQLVELVVRVQLVVRDPVGQLGHLMVANSQSDSAGLCVLPSGGFGLHVAAECCSREA